MRTPLAALIGLAVAQAAPSLSVDLLYIKGRQVVLRSAQGASVRRLDERGWGVSPKGMNAREPRWLPDGSSCLLRGFRKGEDGIFRLEVASGACRLVLPKASDLSLAAPR